MSKKPVEQIDQEQARDEVIERAKAYWWHGNASDADLTAARFADFAIEYAAEQVAAERAHILDVVERLHHEHRCLAPSRECSFCEGIAELRGEQ